MDLAYILEESDYNAKISAVLLAQKEDNSFVVFSMAKDNEPIITRISDSVL